MRESIKYVFDKKGRKYGVVVGLKIGENTFPMIGIARCNLKMDNFSKKEAVKLAKARALKWGNYIMDYGCKEGNAYLHSYLNKFTSFEEEFKFVSAISYVVQRLTKEPNATESTGRA